MHTRYAIKQFVEPRIAVIWTERNCVMYEANTVSSEGLINLSKTQVRIYVFMQTFKNCLLVTLAIWCKNNGICCIVNDKVVFQ